MCRVNVDPSPTLLSALMDPPINSAQAFETEVLVASVRHPIHVLEAAKLGADVVTLPLKIIQQLLKHPLTESGLKKFLDDWEKVKS